MMPMKLMTAFQIQETKESHLATEQKPFITKLVGGRALSWPGRAREAGAKCTKQTISIFFPKSHFFLKLYLNLLAKWPPSGAFPSPFRGGRYSKYTQTNVRTDKQTNVWTDKQTHVRTEQKKGQHAKKKFCAPILIKMV